MGLELGKIKIKRFADVEIYVQLQESVRGCDVFLVQPACPSANENLIELLIMIDACRRASAKVIIVVIRYFGYARADRKKPLERVGERVEPWKLAAFPCSSFLLLPLRLQQRLKAAGPPFVDLVCGRFWAVVSEVYF
ncbi:Ribose-phosphate pyrophosphokinase [Quillaja saponaria]|uniref:ribose-phosphate diphosphokinase n=1 Tax=Quillaja saponaria TaxID=32244 RepID=A0AAD7LQW5_QUISA|nr:Ribose-phosphate pyrophosphokinase [Quillaja saponaria]